MVELNPIQRMKAPKVPKPVRTKVDVGSIDILLDNCVYLRDKVIVLMLIDTGLRRSELASINIGDIDTENEIISVWGKGAKQRVVKYGPRTAELLTKYLQETKPIGKLYGIEPDGIGMMLKRLGKRTGLACNPHAFRRAFATESIRNGMNVFFVQSLLGHESLTMTRIYAEQVNSEDAIKAYKPIVQ